MILIQDERLNPKKEDIKTTPVIALDYCDFQGWYTDAGGVFRLKLDAGGQMEIENGQVNLYDEVEIGVHRIAEQTFIETFAQITEEEYAQMMQASEEGFDEESLRFYKEMCQKYQVHL